MPPHSFAEWVIGQNLPRRIRRPNPPPPPNNEVQQYKLELFTDDELQIEKVALTYPRAVRVEKDEPAEPDNPAAKKVSFSSPSKPAIKKTAATSPPESPQDAPAASDKDADTSSSPEFDYGSDGHGRGRRRRRTKRHRSRSRSSKSASSARDSDDSEPCQCPKCKAKQIKRGLRYRERRLSQKLQELRELEHDSSSDESGTSGDELSRPRWQRHTSKRKQKASPVVASAEDAPQTEESESETSYESYVSTDTDSPRRRRRSRRSHRHYFRKRQSKNATPKVEEVEEKAEEKEPVVKEPEAKEAAAEPPKPQESNKAPAVQPASFKVETVPRQGFVRPNLLLPVKAQVLKVEHAVEEPEDPRPNSFYDVDSGTIRVYHGPVYGNPTGTMYPVRNRNRVASLPVGTPHPMSNPYYEASPFGMPFNPPMNPPMPPPMPYWPSQPPPPLPGLPGYPPVPYYNPMGLEPRARTVSSDSNGRMEAHPVHDYQKRKPGRGKRSPPNRMEESRNRRDNRYYGGSPPDRHQKHRRPSHVQRARENEGNEGAEGLNSNNNAANVFNNDDNNGEGWGRSAWDDPPPPEENKDDSWNNTTPVETWDNGAGTNQADQNGDNWGATDQKDDRWGTGSADNNNNNNGETDYWATLEANETTSQKKWHNDNSGDQNGDLPGPANDNDSWRRSSTGYTGLPSDSNVIPPLAYRKKSKEIRRDSGEAGNWGWVEQPPVSRREHRSMPGAWEDPMPNTQEPIFETRVRPNRARRNKSKAANDGDDFVPSWGDPTAAQSSHDPPAFRNSKEKTSRDAPAAEQW